MSNYICEKYEESPGLKTTHDDGATTKASLHDYERTSNCNGSHQSAPFTLSPIAELERTLMLHNVSILRLNRILLKKTVIGSYLLHIDRVPQ